jgi:NADH:ubiquinone oxidoreductase subunit 2 (subunit N)
MLSLLWTVLLIALFSIFVFGLVSQRHLVASALCLWWCVAVGLVSAGHLAYAGYDMDYLATGALACLTSWILLCGLPPLFEASFMVAVALFGMHWLVISTDVIGFYVGLELANFAGVVLCALHARRSFGLEAALLFLLQSAFSAGFMLLGCSLFYLQRGALDWATLALDLPVTDLGIWLWSCGLLWKAGSAPVHAWVIATLRGVWHSAALFVITVPKFGVLWVWQPICHGIGWVAMISLVVAALGAFGQPLTKTLLAYSAIGMNGLLFFALDTLDPMSVWAGFGFYIWSLALMWPILADPLMLSALDWHRSLVIVLLAASLAGLPPMLGFLGKATIFVSASLYSAPILAVALWASMLSVSYYMFLALLAFSAEVGSILYRNAGSDRAQLLAYRSSQPAWHAGLLVLLLVAFWKGFGLRFTWLN